MSLQLAPSVTLVESHVHPPDDGRVPYTTKPNSGICCPVCCRAPNGPHSYLIWIVNGQYLHCPVREHQHTLGTNDDE